MRLLLLLTIMSIFTSCLSNNGEDLEAITINEDQLIKATGSHPEKIDALYFKLRKQHRVNLELQEKLIRADKIMYEKKFTVGEKQRGLIIAGSGRNDKTYLVLMLTTNDGVPISFKEHSKKDSLSAIYELNDETLEITWYTGSGNELKRHSFDTFKITSAEIK